MRFLGLGLVILCLWGCVGKPEGVAPVGDFNLDRYLGKWYEIARLDHSFERGLEQVTAEYSLRDDGGVRVVNSGFSTKDNKWQEAVGKAYFTGNPAEGHLKVSFFGPFYGSYIVFELDRQDYQYAFISGNSTAYLWLLSRSPAVSPELAERFIAHARKLGFDTNKLIFVRQELTP